MNQLLSKEEWLAALLPTIRKNCRISDATHSGFFSICGLFLRLRDRHLCERGLPPWTDTDKQALLEWIEVQENHWLQHLDLPFEDFYLLGRTVPYLDNRRINAQLLPLGLYYGAGYGRGFKPTFFLGEIREIREFHGFTAVILDQEYVSDLVMSPAARRGKWIIVRLTPLRYFLWGKIQEIEQLEREATAAALAYYDWNPQLPPGEQLERIIREEMETVLYHELGEARDRALPRGLWGDLLGRFPHSRIEIYLRSLKDLLGDTHPSGTLRHIIQNRKAGSFAFYLSNLKGMARLMIPEIVETFYRFREKEDWEAVEKIRRRLRRRLAALGRRLQALNADLLPDRPEDFQRAFEREFIKPLKL
jgi:hypothetical protein